MVIRVDPGATATINATIVDGAGGAAQLTKTDAGTLVLGGANAYTGGTALRGGTLQASEDANLGAASGGLSLDDGTLATTASFASARTITLDTTGGTFAPVAGTTLSLSGPIGGAGSLTKVDAGTLALGGGNSYGGGTFLQGGTLAVLADANLGAASGAMDFNGGTLRLEGGFDPAATRDVTLGALGGSIDTQGFTSTLAQSIHGAGALTKLGAGTLILVADNTFSGSTTIAAGTVQLGNGGTSGSVVGNILDNGALVFNRSDTASYAGIVSGSGMLSVMGGGTLVLGGDSTYTGGTTMVASTLQLGDGGTSGSVAGNVLNDGAVLFDRSDDVGFAGVISGVGTMTKLGTNTLTLRGNNSYTGTTTITGGVLQVGDGGSTGALVGNTVNDGGLTFNRSGSLGYAGAISGSGWVRQRGPGTTVLSGASSYTGGTFISAGTLSVSADQHLGDPSSAVSLNGGTLQLAASFSSDRNLLIDTAGGTIDVTDRNELTGHIDGTGAFIKRGSGALIVNTVANATGPIEVAAGTLVVGDSAHPSAQLAGNGGVNVAAGAFLGGYGQVVGRVNNAGTLGVGNALPALANDLDAQFTIVGPLVNMGSITMVNGAAVDQLIVSGNYVSSGGQLETEAVLNEGGQAGQSDRLVANTVSLAGSPTRIVVHNLGGTGAVTSGDGIALVNVLDAPLSAAGAFVLAGRAVAGPYEYVLFQGGVANPTDGQWYLRSQAQPEPPSTPTPLPPLPEPEPIFRPEVGAYLANRQSAADAMRQTLHDRQGDPQYSREGATDAASTLGKVWLRVQGGNTRSQAADRLLATEGRQSLIQLGGDFGSWTAFSETDRLHVGWMAGYADGRADVTAQFDPAQARGHTDGYFAGAYATWFANNDQRLGAYVDMWLQAGWFNNQVRSSMLPDVHYDSTNWAASVEYGYGFATGKDWVVEPQIQMIYNDYQADSLTDSTGTRVRPLNGSGTIGRLGVRVYPQLTSSYQVRPFIEANWWNGGGTDTITFNGIPVSDSVPTNRYQFNVGLQARTGEGWVIWGRFGGEWDSAQYERVNGQLGVKYNW
ncbi:autotransporter outer membrane beta-barrel domain-containing protein [Lysobacter sp. GCM10012299]|uniref:autotransporter outer membrane beta-barrel domain-containing protein n=1 Tax=Lysobacter sp. GCM10012299 TaxID=3317333 RepID=UPI00360D8ED5